MILHNICRCCLDKAACKHMLPERNECSNYAPACKYCSKWDGETCHDHE